MLLGQVNVIMKLATCDRYDSIVVESRKSSKGWLTILGQISRATQSCPTVSSKKARSTLNWVIMNSGTFLPLDIPIKEVFLYQE